MTQSKLSHQEAQRARAGEQGTLMHMVADGLIANDRYVSLPAASGEAGSYFEVAASLSAPFWARRQARVVLGSWQVSAETIEIAELLVSELITNALKFGEPKPGPGLLPAGEMLELARPISLAMNYLPGRVMIEVGDNGPGSPAFSEARADAVSGRGLMLVQALSKEWGHYLLPSGGKVVYCVLAVA